MKYLALKELPDGTQPGAEIDLHEDVARVLLLVEAVRPAPADDEKSSRRRTYNRRDLKADGSD